MVGDPQYEELRKKFLFSLVSLVKEITKLKLKQRVQELMWVCNLSQGKQSQQNIRILARKKNKKLKESKKRKPAKGLDILGSLGVNSARQRNTIITLKIWESEVMV